MPELDELIELQQGRLFVHHAAGGRAVLVPGLGARVFCELDGTLIHRLDLANVRDPHRAFNNYGGNNFWPAPEGGTFGFNYDGSNWRVQPAINDQPFIMDSAEDGAAVAVKETTLINRKGVALKVVMRRELSVASVPQPVADLNPQAALAYTVTDSIDVIDRVRIDDALIACWTLEQFNATDSTVSFARVSRPQEAVNFDYYDHPGDGIRYAPRGVLYKTNSRKRGQIGLCRRAAAEFIGFYDLTRRFLCLREIMGTPQGLYFNIADNEQPNGPFSAEDTYSIFNGDETLGFFELETVGGAITHDGHLSGSRLISRTTFARWDDGDLLRQFLENAIGISEA